MNFVNSYFKKYLTKRSFIVILKSSRDQLQEYAIKKEGFKKFKVIKTRDYLNQDQRFIY